MHSDIFIAVCMLPALPVNSCGLKLSIPYRGQSDKQVIGSYPLLT